MTSLTYNERPLAIDLFCGLGGWSEGLIAEGWDVIGFDIEQHVYGDDRYSGLLVVQDVTTIHGSQFRNADLIVASPPCQRYSYMAMPWTRAKEQAKRIRADDTGGALMALNELFDACFRIQREASEAAGRHIPMVVENVRGAIPWVGRSRWNFGSFYLWGDVPALMPVRVGGQKFNPDGTNHGQGSWFAIADSKERGSRKNDGLGGGSWLAIGGPGQTVVGNNPVGAKVPGFRFDGSGKSFQTASVNEGRKAPGATQWFNDGLRTPESMASMGSKSPARKRASAMIAKIPDPLSRHIARVFKPCR